MLTSFQFWKHRAKRIIPPGLGKIGVWVQPNAIGNQAAIDFAGWLICDVKVLDVVSEKANGRQVYVAIGRKSFDEYKQIVSASLKKIWGVVIDYEVKGNTVDQSEAHLRQAYSYASAKGLKVAVTSLGDPKTSLNGYGVDYSRSHLWSDFVMPQLYSRLWNNDPAKTLKKYLAELSVASGPVVPLIACATTVNNPGPLAAADLTACYTQLELPAMVFWNIRESAVDFWSAVTKL